MSESKLFKYLSGQHVNVLMKSLKGSQTMMDGTVNRGNIVIEGYLLDEDVNYLFLGETPEKVTEVLLRNEVSRVFTSEMLANEFVELDEPDNNESMN